MDQFDAFARYYDLDMGSFEDDLLLYLEFARRTGGPVLDLMCGTGRVSLALARAGYSVTGLDSAGEMLAQARRKVAAARLRRRVELVQDDLRSLKLERRFPLALIAINSFMHLEQTEEQLAALRGIAEHLQPGGLLVVDLFNPIVSDLASSHGQVVLEKVFRQPQTGHLVQKFVVRHVDLAAQVLEVQFYYDELNDQGAVLRHAPPPFVMRWLYRYEVEHLLSRASLALEAVYGSYELDAYQSDSERLIVVARKE